MIRLCQILPALVAAGSLSLHASDDATHEEVDPLEFEIGPKGKLLTMAMNAKGQLLCGVSWVPEGREPESLRPGERQSPDTRGYGPGSDRRLADPYAGKHEYALKIVDPKNGKVLDTWKMKDGLEPKMIHGCENGYVYIAGGGWLAAFDASGKERKRVSIDETCVENGLASGLCVGDKKGEHYVFLAVGTGNSLRATESFHRFNRDLTNPKKIIDRQYGCCGHIDIEIRDGEFIVAENSRHRVNRFTFDGEQLGTWGKRDRTNIEGFAACCNPCNTDFASGGVLYTAESGVGRVKKFSAEGEYLGFVGYVDTTKFDRGSRLAAQSCYIPIEVSKDESRIYVMDVRAHFIRVLERKS